MSLPKISIITPSFNQGHYIEETILSVLEQGYANLEYIIIDGGSTDKTLEIIKKYEKYLTYWISEKDKGQSEAINKGIRRATGEIINWLNSDDYYNAGALHHIASKFNNPDITAYCGKSRVFSDIKEYISQGTDIYQDNLAKSIGWARIDQPETFFRKVVWQRLGLLNEHFHFIMDKEWWIRYLFQFGLGGIVKDDKVLVNFRIHDSSKTGSQLQGFNHETNCLFYSLASQKGLPIAERIKSVRNLNIKLLKGYENVDSELINTSIHYYLLHSSLVSYAENEYDRSRKIATLIDKDLLYKKDKEELEKVLLRMKLLPCSAKKVINNLGSGIRALRGK